MTEDATAVSTGACAPIDVAPELHADPSPTDGEREASATTTSHE